MAEKHPRPRVEPKSNIGASLPLSEVKRLHELATTRQVTLTKLVVDALHHTYATELKPKV